MLFDGMRLPLPDDEVDVSLVIDLGSRTSRDLIVLDRAPI